MTQQLTIKDKETLLIMCRTLFPGFKWELSDQLGACYFHSPENNKQFIYKGNINGFPLSITHWFEFCICILTEELHNLYKDTNRNIGYIISLE